MEFTDLINKRKSIRGYLSKPVEKEKLTKVLEAARLAPTAKNSQPFKLYIIDTQKNKEKLQKIYHRDWFTEAPYVILICGIEEKSFIRNDGKNYNEIDIAIVFDHLILAATNEGLGTCWIGAFDAQAAKIELELPDNEEPLVFTPLGYPNDQGREKTRKPLTELTTYL